MSSKTIEDKALKIVKNIPSTENGAQTLCYDGKYLITQCIGVEKDRFTLWKVHENGYEKISVSDSPLDFDSVIPWKIERI